MSFSFKVQCFSIWPMDPLWLTYYLGEYYIDTDSLNLGNNARGIQCGLANVLFFFSTFPKSAFFIIIENDIKCDLQGTVIDIWNELKNLKITMKVKREYYIYPLLSLVSDFGHFPLFLLVLTFLRTRPCSLYHPLGGRLKWDRRTLQGFGKGLFWAMVQKMGHYAGPHSGIY